MAIPQDKKDALKSAGKWLEFLEYRDQLKDEGHSPTVASRDALAKFLPDLETNDEFPVLEPAPRGLAGKTAPEATVIRWVANNIDNPDVQPEDCPAPVGWTLLRECRQSPAFRMDFLQSTWVKLLPSRAQLEKDDAKPNELDGQKQMDLIDQIREARRKAEKEVGRVA